MSGKAGYAAAGDGGAGFGPDVTAPTARDVTPPHALFFDPALMDFPTDADGHYESVHPVDAKVELALALAFGSSASAPAVGSTLRDLRIASRAKMSADARQIVDVALASLIAAGDVRVVSVVAYAANGWRAHVEVTYQNLRAPDADRNRTSVVN